MNGRYYRFSEYVKKRFGCRVQRISLDAGFSCPNRDGTISKSGCVYCDNRAFSTAVRTQAATSLSEQLTTGLDRARRQGVQKFMAYFQAYTNTYAPVPLLKERYDIIKTAPDIVALAIGTRPDCVPDAVLDLIGSYTQDYEVWIEYGLQSAREGTLKAINRGHGIDAFVDAVHRTRMYHGINICAHVILGLPGETADDMLATARVLARLGIDGVKIHPLHVVKDTMLEQMFRRGDYEPLTADDYATLVVQFLEQLPPTTIIQRLTADCPPELLVAPGWIAHKANMVTKIENLLASCNTCQGKCYCFE